MNPPVAARKYLVTGATGFIGGHLTRALLEAHGPDSVVAFVNPHRRPSEATAFDLVRQRNARIVECDLLELPRVRPTAPPFDVLIHLAGCAEPENPRADVSVNDVGTHRLLEWLGPALRGRRFIYASTLACVDRARPLGAVTEQTPCSPRTPYGITKLRAEEIIRTGSAEFGYEFTILRLCTIIGPGFRPTGMLGVCPKLLERGAVSTRFNWPGRSSFLGVDDLVRIIQDLAAEPRAAQEVFVTSNGEDPTFDTVLDLIARIHDIERRRVTLPRLLWRLLGAGVWRVARSAVTPARMRIPCWRAANVIYDGIRADASKLNQLVGDRYQSVHDALRQAYAKR